MNSNDTEAQLDKKFLDAAYEEAQKGLGEGVEDGRGVGNLRPARRRGPRSVRDARRKRATAFARLSKPAAAQREIRFQLLMLEHLDTLANTAAQAISNIKFDKVIVWEGGGKNGNGDGTSNTSQFLQSMARSMPPMMQIQGHRRRRAA